MTHDSVCVVHSQYPRVTTSFHSIFKDRIIIQIFWKRKLPANYGEKDQLLCMNVFLGLHFFPSFNFSIRKWTVNSLKNLFGMTKRWPFNAFMLFMSFWFHRNIAFMAWNRAMCIMNTNPKFADSVGWHSMHLSFIPLCISNGNGNKFSFFSSLCRKQLHAIYVCPNRRFVHFWNKKKSAFGEEIFDR